MLLPFFKVLSHLRGVGLEKVKSGFCFLFLLTVVSVLFLCNVFPMCWSFLPFYYRQKVDT